MHASTAALVATGSLLSAAMFYANNDALPRSVPRLKKDETKREEANVIETRLCLASQVQVQVCLFFSSYLSTVAVFTGIDFHVVNSQRADV